MLVLEKEVSDQDRVAGPVLARDLRELAEGIDAVRERALDALERGDTRAVRCELERLDSVHLELLKCLVPSA